MIGLRLRRARCRVADDTHRGYPTSSPRLARRIVARAGAPTSLTGGDSVFRALPSSQRPRDRRAPGDFARVGRRGLHVRDVARYGGDAEMDRVTPREWRRAGRHPGKVRANGGSAGPRADRRARRHRALATLRKQSRRSSSPVTSPSAWQRSIRATGSPAAGVAEALLHSADSLGRRPDGSATSSPRGFRVDPSSSGSRRRRSGLDGGGIYDKASSG